ncbi:MAG: pilus assembly protein, partial [Lysobacteraceae bacterium]
MRPPLFKQAGTTAVEFALLAGVFFTFVFGTMEVARLLYVYNTLQEVTRRAAEAASTVYPTDTNRTAWVRRHAIFRDDSGELAAAPPVTDHHIRLDYLRFDLAVIPEGAWPADAAANRQICMGNPRAANCIRFVQASVCNPAQTGECTAVTSQMLLPLVDLPVRLHRAI